MSDKWKWTPVGPVIASYFAVHGLPTEIRVAELLGVAFLGATLYMLVLLGRLKG